MQDTKDEARSCVVGYFEAVLQMSGAARRVNSSQDIFKQYDDGDGVLSREELKRMQANRCVLDELIHQSPHRIGMLKAENAKLAEAVSSLWSESRQALGDSPCSMQVDFDKLDTDGDGVVSKDELAAALVSPADESPSDWDSMQDTKDQDIFKQYDDGDGVLSRDELKRMQAENSKLAEAVGFDKLDTDGDGVISKDELAAALDWDSMQETKNEDSLQVAITVQSAAALSQQSRELLDSSRMASQRKEKRKAKRKEQAATQAAQAQAVEATRLASGPLRASVDGQKIPAGGVPEGKETELPGDLLRDSKEDLADTERALTKREEPEDAISMAGGAQLVTSLNAQSTENELETSGKEVAGAEGHMLAAKRPSVSPEGSGQDRDMKPTMESGSRDPPQFPVEMAPFKEDPHQRQAQRQGLEPAQSSPDLPFETF
ncbi:CML14 [Symbiodinium sp. CCMP2456]|nr:CML14 [Symbiodinium sp. CCMP2456]